ncbi:MAG: hypothetical protein E7016_07130 [Alphaproteobacteria bacterium]|nr:hypothetical protein [Alphaproteobacteria bacterium]
MKKIILIFAIFLGLCTNANADIYHGIDIDAVYNSSDWSSKDKIKDIIDDYTLTLQYKSKLTQCSKNIERFNCMDLLAEKVITHFYNYNMETNLQVYHNYVNAIFDAYGVVYCLNKYNVPAGTLCNIDNEGKSALLIEQYINDLILQIQKDIFEFDFIKNYN